MIDTYNARPYTVGDESGEQSGATTELIVVGGDFDLLRAERPSDPTDAAAYDAAVADLLGVVRVALAGVA
jgi:hypothetical protein